MADSPLRARAIKHLPLALANQIAAGEVVERPASVVKELIENALDANAKRIQIDIEGGGCGLIRIRDDGSGIPAAELSLALDRHATSKVECASDLEQIATLGFRGEALPSIAAVSRLELVSCGDGCEHGARVAHNGGNSEGPAVPIAHPRGTSVSVRELFFNTPARRKFLRSERTELGRIRDVVRQFSLCRFDIEWRLNHHDRSLYNLPTAATSSAMLNRLTRVCGKAFTDNVLRVEVQAQSLRLHGWASTAAVGRAYADLQLFYINQRPVRDPLIRHALRLAYQGVIDEGRYPGYVLFLELPSAQVDVNVHPTKHEVRFHEARLVHDFVHRRLRQQLDGVPLSVVGGDGGGYRDALGSATIPYTDSEQSQLLQVHDVQPQKWPAPSASVAAVGARSHAKAFPMGAPPTIVLLLARHAIISSDDRYWLLDHCAAAVIHARQVLRAAPVPSRPLLLPYQDEVSTAVADYVEHAEQSLRRLGVEIRRTGEASVSLRQVPIVLAGVAPLSVLQAVSDSVQTRTPSSDSAAQDPDDALYDDSIAQALADIADQSTTPAAQRLAILFNALRNSDAAALPMVELSTERLNRWLSLK